MTERILSEVQAAEVGFCEESTVWHFVTKVRSCEIRRALNVNPLLRIERSQLHWLMSYKRLASHLLLTTPTGKRPRGRPRTRWLHLRPGLVPSWCGAAAEISEIAENRDVFGVPELLSPPSPKKKLIWKWIKWIGHFSNTVQLAGLIVELRLRETELRTGFQIIQTWVLFVSCAGFVNFVTKLKQKSNKLVRKQNNLEWFHLHEGHKLWSASTFKVLYVPYTLAQRFRRVDSVHFVCLHTWQDQVRTEPGHQRVYSNTFLS